MEIDFSFFIFFKREVLLLKFDFNYVVKYDVFFGIVY